MTQYRYADMQSKKVEYRYDQDTFIEKWYYSLFWDDVTQYA